MPTTSEQRVKAAATGTITTTMEDALPDETDILYPPSVEGLKLVKPEGAKSRFWTHFMRYDADYHPDKKTFARCDLCGKEISVKQGTGGLKNHLKFKHNDHYKDLFDGNPPTSPMVSRTSNTSGNTGSGSGGDAPIKAEGGSASSSGGGKNKKQRTDGSNPYLELSMRMDADKRQNERHLMEMWSLARKEIRDIRKEMKEEEDADVIEELKRDVSVLMTRKRKYEDQLGFPKDTPAANGDVSEEV